MTVQYNSLQKIKIKFKVAATLTNFQWTLSKIIYGSFLKSTFDKLNKLKLNLS